MNSGCRGIFLLAKTDLGVIINVGHNYTALPKEVAYAGCVLAFCRNRAD